jgi:dynein heavy chain
MNAKS